jgi:hypothetical protein
MQAERRAIALKLAIGLKNNVVNVDRELTAIPRAYPE